MVVYARQLGRQKDFLARDAGFPDSLANLGFVGVTIGLNNISVNSMRRRTADLTVSICL